MTPGTWGVPHNLEQLGTAVLNHVVLHVGCGEHGHEHRLQITIKFVSHFSLLLTRQKLEKQKYWKTMKDPRQPTRLKMPGMIASPRMLAMVVLTSAAALAFFILMYRIVSVATILSEL